MIGWLVLYFFSVAFITTALFVEGQKQMKNVIVVKLENEPTFPKKHRMDTLNIKERSGLGQVHGMFLENS